VIAPARRAAFAASGLCLVLTSAAPSLPAQSATAQQPAAEEPAAPPPAAPPRDSANASFWQRWDDIGDDPLHSPYEWYQPKVSIAGAPGPWLPEARGAARAFSARTLDAAAQFAEHTNGQVQLERYFGGANADTLFSSHSMARTLNALAIGVAIANGRIGSVDNRSPGICRNGATRRVPRSRSASG